MGRAPENVVVVFTDLVGSTELSTRVGADAADVLRRRHFELLRAPLDGHGGREVKNLGDGIMAVFGGVGAALDAAVAMQQAFDAHNAAGEGERLTIRVGVAAGDCTEEDGDYFGEPVIVAARLCAQAEAGRILAPEVVRLLAPRGRHEFAPFGELELKGIPEPVAAVEVVWRPAEVEPPAVIPLPGRLGVRHGVGFVGRESELERLRAAWKAAAGGERRAVLVSGEAGLGKTRLISEFAGEVFDADAMVLYGRCDEDLVTAYRPWVELLGHLVAHASDDDLARIDRRSLAELGVLLPALRDRAEVAVVSAAAGDDDQYVLFAAVTDLLETFAAQRPVVILLDDLHWADRPTLQLLRHVVAATATAPILLIGTYRETDLGADHPLTETLASLRRDAGVERVALAGLSDVEVIAFLETSAGHEMAADGVALAHAVRSETGGNPFFVGELLLHLAESGVIARDVDGRWAATVELAEVGLPQSVREVVGARVRRLGDEVGRMLTAAAVAGREFDVAVVAGAADLDDDRVLDLLETAMPAGLVREVPGVTDRFTFTHALVQHTLYQDLAESRRARLHRRVAETIEALADTHPGRAAELANHWFAATRPADVDKAIGYAIDAGDEALAALAPAEAVRWYRKALDTIPTAAGSDEHRRGDLLVRLGTAERQAGDPAYRTRLLDAAHLAQHLGDDALLVVAALANSRGWHSISGAVDTERVEVLEAALAAVGDADSPERARLLVTLARELSYGDHQRRRALGREGVAVARRTGDPATILDATLLEPLDTPDTHDERLRAAAEVLALTEGDADPVRRERALDWAINAALRTGDTPALRRATAERRAITERLGQPILRWNALNAAALVALLVGDIDEAERLANEALEIGVETAQPDAMLFYGPLLMGIRWFQGRERELTPLIAQAADDNPGIPTFHAVLAFHLADTGDLEAAHHVFDALAADDFSFPYDQVWLGANVFAAEAAFLLGDSDAAALLSERLEPFTDQVVSTGVVSCLGAVSHSAGLLCSLLGRTEEAEALLVDALERNTRLEAPFLRARTMLALAALVEAADPERARTLIDDALALADTYAMAGIRERAIAMQSEVDGQ